jgi:sec-independent protein translocase protein TatA
MQRAIEWENRENPGRKLYARAASAHHLTTPCAATTMRAAHQLTARSGGVGMFDGAFQPTHLLIVLIVVGLLFGAKRLPDLGKSLGSSIREFKKSVSEIYVDVAEERPAPIMAEPRALAGETLPTVPASSEPTENDPTDVAAK